MQSGKQKKKIKVIENGPIFCIHPIQNTGHVWIGTDLPGKSIVILTSKGKPISALDGHTKKVNAMIEVNGNIWTCSSDKTIMIWKFDGECVRSLQGHAGPIFNMIDTGKHVWSASWDKTVILWDSEVCF